MGIFLPKAKHTPRPKRMVWCKAGKKGPGRCKNYMMQQKISQFEKNISKDDAAKPDEHASIVKLKKTDQRAAIRSSEAGQEFRDLATTLAADAGGAFA